MAYLSPSLPPQLLLLENVAKQLALTGSATL